MPQTLPLLSTPATIITRFMSNTSVFSSPLTSAFQVAARFGGVWEIEYQMPPMSRRQSGEWLSLMIKANGQATSIYVGPHAPKPVDFHTANAPYNRFDSASLRFNFLDEEYYLRWISTPLPLVKGSSQTLGALNTDGWVEGDGLNPGDYISFENGTFRELHIVTDEAFADSNGDMTIPIAPNIRRSPSDNAVVTIINATGEFLALDRAQANETFMGKQGARSMTISFREFLR